MLVSFRLSSVSVEDNCHERVCGNRSGLACMEYVGCGRVLELVIYADYHELKIRIHFLWGFVSFETESCAVRREEFR